jgi:hypothetical protein
MDSKPFYMSKTNWGTIIAFISLIGTQFGWDIGDTDGWVTVITGAAGAILAVYGRAKAVKKIEPVI